MMMRGRTYLPLLYILVLSMATMAGLMTPKSAETNAEVQVIPSEAIRLRILANSNHESDQELKRKIRDEVNTEINTWVAELTSIEEARALISSRLDEIETIAKDVMEREGNVQKVDVQFGKTVFPTKLYGQYLYPAGEYEAIKISLGAGEGENWWCVLFPPLCFLDFSSGTAVKAETIEGQTVPQSEEAPIDEAVNQVDVEEAPNDQVVPSADDEKAPVNQSIEQEGEKQEADKSEDVNQSIDEEQTSEETKVVYDERDVEEVEVKFFLKELFDSLF
ncbi:stage II sporulation protein R [Pradoshia sp.]